MDERLNKLGILITSHPKQQRFWPHGLGSWEGCPFYKLMGYDDLETSAKEVPFDKFMPPVNELFFTNYPKGYIGHFRGELEQMKKGGLILKERGMEWFYKTAADTTCWKWRNLQRMFAALGNLDFVMCGTAIIFGKVDSLNKCMELWNPNLKSGGAELYFNSQIRAFDMKNRPEKPPWWDEILGRVHTQGEYALNNDITVIRTWVDGHVWGDDFKHRDIVEGKY
jgi:hypothetical protein